VPALNDVSITPVEPPLLVDKEHDMVVVAHDCIGGNVNGIDASEHQQAIFDPLATVFVVTTTLLILTAKKGAAHAAGCAVVVRGGIE
jgi:hypothetical protein